ncbi:hypothetical protein KR026_010112 [Drosophila bipectinata]|nr:hypothetical protein KR026_010112 [Drosophila bipectinata]
MRVAPSGGSRFNGATSGNQNSQLKLQMNAWQPFTQHNNWLILQATAPSSQDIRERRKEQKQEVQGQELQHQGLPINYYAYNHRYNDSVAGSLTAGGNYKQVPPAIDPASYVLAISQQMRRGPIQRQLPEAEEAKPEVNELPATLTNQVNGDDDDDETNAIDFHAEEHLSPRGIESYLEPFERALVKVRDFCDSVRSFISDEPDVPVSNKLNAAAPGETSKELVAQGRRSRLPTAEWEGRKLKKLKKKLQKLFLPLLIAYKLKFLTLIPVLIGGLTLLVGTTGLAGFFFALFTAVMSLKTSAGGHGSKGLVLKKLT